MKLKHQAKKLIRLTWPTNLPPVVVASMGRSGSTLVCKALRQAFSVKRFPASVKDLGLRVVTDTAWDLSEKSFRKGVVYKTHGLAEEFPVTSKAKVIFLFGCASDAALSVLSCHESKGEKWIEEHFEHLRARGTFAELSQRDVLRFEEQIDGWMGLKGTERLILHYDALWDHEDTLAKFVGAPVALPVRQARKGPSAVDKNTRSQFEATYAALDAKIKSMPQCQWLN